jgi:hypothetical protein
MVERVALAFLGNGVILHYNSNPSIGTHTESKKMLKLIPRHRFHVPHGLAMAGALLILASTVTGLGSTLQNQPGQPVASANSVLAESEADAGRQGPESMEAVQPAPVKKKARFKINLFHFRR